MKTRSTPTQTRRRSLGIAAAVVGAVLFAACGDDSSVGSPTDPAAPPTAAPTTVVATSPAGSGTEPAGTAASSPEETSFVTAPESARVDLDEPTFTDPTAVTNNRFPIADLDQVIQLGEEAGASLRFEVTLLPDTKMIEWDGQQVETLMSQFVAYEDGQVLEVAVDFFAQADDGAVWYFGEDVANYVDGVLDNDEGTWLAGKDGPPGMIMPADPQVGDVYRPENIPGFVFEEVTVKSVGETVEGPTGPVDGAIIVEELLMDGLREAKTFAPGYGEFFFAVEAEQEVVDMALAVPTDALGGDVPTELSTIATGVEDLAAALADGDWDAATLVVDDVTAAWDSFRGADTPPLLDAQMATALEGLTSAVRTQDAAAAGAAAIDVGHAGLDFQLRHRAPADVDTDRLDLWDRQLALDESSGDEALTAGDRVVIETIRARTGQA